MISKELIKQIVNEYKGDDIANYLHAELELVEDIKTSIKVINQDMDKENSRHEASIKTYKGRLKSCKERCKHWTHTYYPDPSGNNDSFNRCDICGKEF